MGGKSARTKGHSFERAIANEFVELGWKEAKRHLEMQFQEAQGFDLDNTYPFKVQCKKWKDYCPISTMKEISFKAGEIPVLITAADYKDPMVVLKWEDLKRLLKILKDDEKI